MAPKRSLGLAAALVAVLASLLALVAFRPAGGAPPAHDPVFDRLLAELRELGRAEQRTGAALARLEELLASRLAAPTIEPSARSPLELPTPASFEALARSLDAVRAAFERESAQTRELIRAAPGFPAESLREVRTRRGETDWSALEELEERWRTDPEAADRSQHFQTQRDLLEAFGPPTAIYRPESGMLFHYRRLPEDVPGPSSYFRLQDGFVVEFFIEGEPEEETP